MLDGWNRQAVADSRPQFPKHGVHAMARRKRTSWFSWLFEPRRGFGLRSSANRQPAGRKSSTNLLVERLEDRWLPSASVFTNKPDYAPGETALINGEGFQVGETVNLQV